MRWEARQPGLAARNQIADLVLLHKLAPSDPCAVPAVRVDLAALLQDTP
jgi:hypothetical protein